MEPIVLEKNVFWYLLRVAGAKSASDFCLPLRKTRHDLSATLSPNPDQEKFIEARKTLRQIGRVRTRSLLRAISA